jgi:hypothetical protein
MQQNSSAQAGILHEQIVAAAQLRNFARENVIDAAQQRVSRAVMRIRLCTWRRSRAGEQSRTV